MRLNVETEDVALEQGEVVGGGLYGDDVGAWVTGVEPEDAGADVGATVEDEGLAAGGYDLVVEAVEQFTVRRRARHIVLAVAAKH